jgi:hypothetical protein
MQSLGDVARAALIELCRVNLYKFLGSEKRLGVSNFQR